MKFEKYRLSNEACEYMREGLKHLQPGDCFFIRIVRDKNNAQTLYNAAEFPQKYSDIAARLYLMRVSQYKNQPAETAERQKECLEFLIPRRKCPSPLKMDWLD